VNEGVVVGRGWTQPGGRPHAEAMAFAEAGDGARGATLYVTLEPCAHQSVRGPACADLAADAGVARTVIGIEDPDHRTQGTGAGRLEAAGIAVTLANNDACRASLAGYLSRKLTGLPLVTLKLALTADGFIARTDGSSRWITGEEARAHAHVERAMSDAILVGGATLRADDPRLDVRLPGLEGRSPRRLVLTRGKAPAGWQALAHPRDIARLEDVQYLLVEGGAGTAGAFLGAGLVGRLLLYRAPVAFGEGIAGLPGGVPEGFELSDRRQLGSDTLEVYQRR
jgi:diaminohydroxyphosphoribosylaminopyrimidine deaminase/5-amino-6-(5-phosphoribosylamino)uracil reductase